MNLLREGQTVARNIQKITGQGAKSYGTIEKILLNVNRLKNTKSSDLHSIKIFHLSRNFLHLSREILPLVP